MLVVGNCVLVNIWQSEDYMLIDMGDDDFICGKLYLMIDLILCN